MTNPGDKDTGVKITWPEHLGHELDVERGTVRPVPWPVDAKREHDRMAAAERLARLVISSATNPSVTWAQLHAEAKRVLGEEA